MTGWFAGTLEAVAIAAMAGALASAAVTLALSRLGTIRVAARRADAVVFLGLLPMAVGITIGAALMLPSMLHVTGVRADHCDLHSHHAHLCALHSPGHHVPLVALGLLALVFTGWRASKLAHAQWRSTRLLSQLEALGLADEGGAFPVVTVPGSPWLCVAAGVWRRRVLVSGSLSRRMTPRQASAVLAHEVAHLDRNDPVMKVLLAWAGLFATPSTARAVQAQFSDAAEQASDAEAALAVGALDLAESLVSVARIVRSSAPATGMAFGGSSLERRVATLLHDGLDVRPSRAVFVAFGLASVGAVATPLWADTIHHTVETVLGFLV
ncbi:MAG: hypothetical protein ACI8PZ_002075 [Myxococcota bacterium]|jgi:hypothetical protein